jgi:hypothetical protein
LQPDLQGLEISPGELRHLSGVDPSEVFRPALLKNASTRWSFWFQETLISLALTPILVGLLHVFLILPTIGISLPIAIASLILVPAAIMVSRWLWLKHKSPASLSSLFDEVDRYHAVIQAIHISDQLEAARTNEVTLSDREQVIAALKLTKDNLIRALAAERILRENHRFIAGNPELVLTNFSALQALQVSNQASEYGRLLNEALQISLGVQAEMRKLQSPRSPER